MMKAVCCVPPPANDLETATSNTLYGDLPGRSAATPSLQVAEQRATNCTRGKAISELLQFTKQLNYKNSKYRHQLSSESLNKR